MAGERRRRDLRSKPAPPIARVTPPERYGRRERGSTGFPARVLAASRIVLFADDPLAARLAAIDLGELGSAKIAIVPGGTRAWQAAGLPVVASPNDPPDAERIDYLFWNHDRHAGNREAMQAYLRWETELPEQIAARRPRRIPAPRALIVEIEIFARRSSYRDCFVAPLLAMTIFRCHCERSEAISVTSGTYRRTRSIS